MKYMYIFCIFWWSFSTLRFFIVADHTDMYLVVLSFNKSIDIKYVLLGLQKENDIKKLVIDLTFS